MEKLIELLNKYSKERHNLAMRELNWELWQWFHYLSSWISYSELLMISKKYEFIKWLVEKDKIDYEKLNELNDRYRCLEPYEAIVMQLSISDNPIQDLISLLK